MALASIDITPDIAEKMLQLNYEGQRRLSNSWVRKLADDMEAGRWNDDNGDIIMIDEHGNLINGQHRLNAVVMSGVTIKAIVQTDVPTKAYKFIDGNMKRKAADAINAKNSNICAAIAKAAASLHRGMGLNRALMNNPTTKAEQVEFYENNSDTIDRAVEIYRRFRSTLGKGSSIGYGLAIFMYLRYAPEIVEYAYDCMDDIVPKDDRVVAFVNHAQRGIISDNYSVSRQFAMAMEMFDAISEDRPMKKVIYTEPVIDRWDARIEKWRNR